MGLFTKDPELPVADLGDLWATSTTQSPQPRKRRRGRNTPRELAEPIPPVRGWARPFGGRAPLYPPLPTFRGSTGQVQGLYPWPYGASMPPVVSYIGVDCLSG